MREIVVVQLGRCGNQMGAMFWSELCKEHGLDTEGEMHRLTNQNEKLQVYFDEIDGRRFVPRALLMDLEPGAIDEVQFGAYGNVFSPDKMLRGDRSASNNYGKGYYTDGADLSSAAMEMIRKEAEKCDCIQGFQLLHSVGGGTGSGFGALLLEKMKDEYSDRITSTFTVFPSPKVSDVVVEPYNSVMGLNSLILNADHSMCFDNEALHYIATRRTKTKTVGYEGLNALVAMVTAGITSSLRYYGQLNADLRKLAVNMIPFPRLHFLISGIAPLFADEYSPSKIVVKELIRQCFDCRSLMCAVDAARGKYLTASVIFRGKHISTAEIEEQTCALQNRNSSYFVKWIDSNIKTTICDVPSTHAPTSATFLGNSTAIQEVFLRISDQLTAMLRRKAFLHWFTQEGMEEMEFIESQSNMDDLISEYQQYQDAE